MQNDIVLAFAKNATAYFKQASETIDKAYSLIGETLESQEQLSSINPSIVEKLASLTRFNGSLFLPDGMEKHAEACLSVHQTTAQLLDQVLDEYATVKQAYDQLTATNPSLGSVSSGSYATARPEQRKVAAYDSDEYSQAFDNFNRRTLEALAKYQT
jgi:hypothetical protein